MSKTKKIVICVAIGLLLFVSGFGIGRGFRLARVSEASSGTEQQLNDLKLKCDELEQQLELRIKECENLEQQLGSVNTGLDECISIAGSVRQSANDIAATGSNITVIVKKLRERINEYENTIDELDTKLQQLKNSANEQ